MKKNNLRKGVSAVLAVVMCFSTFLSTGSVTAFAAGEKAEAYITSFPREGDANYDGTWGHSSLNFMNGWKQKESTKTNTYGINSRNGKVCYCIEPGTPLSSGDEFVSRDESYWDNYPSTYNKTISGDEVKLFIGRIMQYGYQGNISTSWRSQNTDDANNIAHIVQGMFLFDLGEKIKCLNKVHYPVVYDKFSALADFLGCSKTALAIRMKKLGLLEQEYLDNPHDYLAIYPEVSR